MAIPNAAVRHPDLVVALTPDIHTVGNRDELIGARERRHLGLPDKVAVAPRAIPDAAGVVQVLLDHHRPADRIDRVHPIRHADDLLESSLGDQDGHVRTPGALKGPIVPALRIIRIGPRLPARDARHVERLRAVEGIALLPVVARHIAVAIEDGPPAVERIARAPLGVDHVVRRNHEFAMVVVVEHEALPDASQIGKARRRTPRLARRGERRQQNRHEQRDHRDDPPATRSA
jgi:hypothetical protein